MKQHVIFVALVVASVAAVGDAAKESGYLPDGGFDVLAVLPPAPVKGDPRYDADRAIFQATRKLIGSDRYAMATGDVHYDDISVLRDFSCSAGVSLTPEDAPRTLAMLHRATVDTETQTSIAKDHYKRLRPFQIDKGKICDDKKELAKSYDYPSGHTTMGWTWALVLSDLLPDHATALLARGRAYGESRFVCGAHNESAVEGGRLSASATMTAVRQTSAYQTDAAAARSELLALMSDPAARKPVGCEKEAKLIAQRVLPPYDKK